MKQIINKNKAIRVLEVMLETQSNEHDMWGNSSTAEKAERLLKTLLLLPEESVTIMLTDEEQEVLNEWEGI